MPLDELICDVQNACMMQTLSDVIDAFGGYAKLASALDCPPGTTSAWKTRGSIPARYWSKIVEKANELGIEGITFDVLGRIAAQREVA